MTAVATAVRHTPAPSDLTSFYEFTLAPLAPQARQVRHPVLPRRAATPDLVKLAELSARLPRRASDAIEILMAAARPFDDGFPPLRPLWAQEATHRALTILRLFIALQRWDRGRRSLRSSYERRLALHLAAVLASLETTPLMRIVPCSGPLRETARDLVALFGPAVGQVVLDMDVTQLSLPAYKRRALVLLGHELIANALTHAFKGRSIGQLSLRLQRMDANYARLQVGDDGIGLKRRFPNSAMSVAGGLADLLEGEIHYLNPMCRGTLADLVVKPPGFGAQIRLWTCGDSWTPFQSSRSSTTAGISRSQDGASGAATAASSAWPQHPIPSAWACRAASPSRMRKSSEGLP